MLIMNPPEVNVVVPHACEGPGLCQNRSVGDCEYHTSINPGDEPVRCGRYTCGEHGGGIPGNRWYGHMQYCWEHRPIIEKTAFVHQDDCICGLGGGSLQCDSRLKEWVNA